MRWPWKRKPVSGETKKGRSPAQGGPSVAPGQPARTGQIGCDMQFPAGKRDQTCDVVVGFDFGTSCSKVVLRTPYHNDSRACAVHFGEAAHSSWCHLLPSVLSVGTDGQCALGNDPRCRVYRDIKFHLVRSQSVPPVGGGGEAIDADALAVAFLSLGLRRARAWFLASEAPLYQDYLLAWHFNLGLPSADYADVELSRTYKRISEAAWLLSVGRKEVTVEAAREALAAVTVSGGEKADPSAEVSVIPEVAAAVVGYARSHLRDEGLHVLVDIGASTLDVCAFLLRTSGGEDRYELLTADVQQLGTMALYRGRVRGVHDAVTAHVSDLWSKCDPVMPIPETPSEYLPQADMLTKHVTKASEQYEAKCRQTLWKTIIELKMRRDPNSPRWRTQLPFFVCGGGSALAFYSNVIDRLSGELADLYRGCQGIERRLLPKPEQLVADSNESNYHRLGVAWGLSYPDYDIGAIGRPSDIPDVPPPPRREERDEPWER